MLYLQTVSEHQGEAGKCIVRINLFRDHRQTIQYILPTDHHKLAQVIEMCKECSAELCMHSLLGAVNCAFLLEVSACLILSCLLYD